jgi:hypothetical protein
MPLPAGYSTQGPSCFDRMKMGFMMGMCVGMASGKVVCRGEGEKEETALGIFIRLGRKQ